MAVVNIQNSSQQRIRRFILAVEFLRRGHHLLTTTFAASTRGTDLPRVSDLPARFREEMPDQLLPGDHIILHASNAIVTTGCPSQVRIVEMYVEGPDAAPYNYMSSVARTDPELIEVPDQGVVVFSPSTPGFPITIRVDAQGNATLRSVEKPASIDKPSGDFFRLLKDWVRVWKFVPGTFNGKPITSDSDMVLRPRSTNDFEGGGWPSDCENKECTFSALDMVVGTGPESTIRFWYGGIPFPMVTR